MVWHTRYGSQYSLSRMANNIIQSMFKPLNCPITFQYLNQVILWDKIIRRGENAVLDLTQRNCKYYFFDDGAGLR